MIPSPPLYRQFFCSCDIFLREKKTEKLPHSVRLTRGEGVKSYLGHQNMKHEHVWKLELYSRAEKSAG